MHRDGHDIIHRLPSTPGRYLHVQEYLYKSIIFERLYWQVFHIDLHVASSDSDAHGDLEEAEQASPYAVGQTHKTLYKT